MKQPYDPEDPAEMDKWIRAYFNIKDESTDAFLVRNGISADTPQGFVKRMTMALAWLWPQLTTRTRPLYYETKAIVDQLDRQASGIRAWHPPAKFPLPPASAEADRAKYIAKREQAMSLFEQAKSIHRLEPSLAAQAAYKQAQSERASKPRKLDEEQCKRIAKLYWASKQDGTGYGVVKELAREFNVSQTTIQNTARKYKPESIDK